MKGKLFLDALLERLPFLKSQGVCLGDNRHDIDNVRELLQDHNINGLQRVPRRLNEEQAAVNPGILDVALALGGELFPEVGRVLVLDVLDNWIPAAVIVHQVTVARGVNNVQPEADAILLDDVRNGLDIGG